MADANWGWKKRSDDKELKQKRFRDFSSMADADWGWGFGPNLKRGPRITKRFRDFGSMADAEWGWGFGPNLKRDEQKSADYQSVPDVEALSTPKRGIQRSYKYRQPYMRARPRADRIQPYQAYARYGAISRPQTRKLGNRQYAFYSMADAPWGWKKRSELPALQDLNEEIEDTNPMEEELEKRNVASMARSNMFPRKLRSYDEMRAGDENNLDLIEEKEEDTSNH